MVIPWEEYMKVKGNFALENDILYYEIKIAWFVSQLIYYTIYKLRLDRKELQRNIFHAVTEKLLLIGH